MSRFIPATRAGRPGIAAVLAALLVLTGCATTGSEGGVADGRALTITTSFEISDLDPLDNGFWGNEFGYSELLLRPTFDGKPDPWLATDLRNTSPTTWELALNEGITFQNGTELDAEALVACLRYQLREDPSVRAALPGATVSATGPLQVSITTTEPVPNMPNILAEESMFKVYDQAAYDRAKGDPAALLEAELYTGPYVVRSLDSEIMKLEPNPDYWDGRPALDDYSIRFIEDAQARLLAVRNGEADLALYPPTAMGKTLEGSTDAFYLTSTPRSPTFALYFNQRRAPFDDRAVRKAVQQAVDYRQIADEVMNGLYEPATGIYGDSMPYAVRTQQTDLAAARAVLDEAGWVAGPDGVRVKDGEPLTFEVVTYPQQPDSEALAVAMQSQLKAVGVEVTVRSVPDITATLNETDGWQAGISGAQMVSFSGDPIIRLRDYYLTDSLKNRGGIADPELDAMIGELSVELDEQRRHELLRSIQRRIGERAHVVYLGMRLPNAVGGPRMKDYEPNPMLLWVDARTAPTG
ncbi:ABC transporter substrate-binding protein [Amycolatopsis cihanbeyliensis]|uniref:Peptide/nickel transport system substrate-binding protein n=1 Tax=Amycolatopsis cihanbeyliensis TaxID=1128664 RepID=A0A542DR63_AMYCI|nr:ABC transporter substrate-binding protein [Amycolatopsis cihanbeyliensis]TQJ05593.1 peptide/nickel transport system substrate-binding protein [Amycolatopsis cihanbeyliensis]